MSVSALFTSGHYHKPGKIYILFEHFVTSLNTGLDLLRPPSASIQNVYMYVRVLYISLLKYSPVQISSSFSSLFPSVASLLWTLVININFISSLAVFFPYVTHYLTHCWTASGTYASLLFFFACYPFFSGLRRFDLYHHSRTRLDLCNFYGPSVRISARTKHLSLLGRRFFDLLPASLTVSGRPKPIGSPSHTRTDRHTDSLSATYDAPRLPISAGISKH